MKRSRFSEGKMIGVLKQAETEVRVGTLRNGDMPTMKVGLTFFRLDDHKGISGEISTSSNSGNY